jgi:hypothetical protein
MSATNPQFFIRLAQVYLAAAQSSQMRLDGRYLPDWLEVFLIEAAQYTTNIVPADYIQTRISFELMEPVLTEMGLSPSK